MKKQKVILFTIILLLWLIIVSIILNQNRNIKKESITIKEMSESTQVSDLQEQINQLNASHTEYMNYIQTCKNQIAAAITNEGVETSEEATFETMVENISGIFTERTKLNSNVAATADNITEGKQAYVNGELITGNGADNNSYYIQGIDFSKGKIGYFTVSDSSNNLNGSTSVEGTVLCAGVTKISGSYQGTGLTLSWSGNTISYTFNHNGANGYGNISLTIYYCYN